MFAANPCSGSLKSLSLLFSHFKARFKLLIFMHISRLPGRFPGLRENMFEITEHDDYLSVLFLAHPGPVDIERAIVDVIHHPHYAEKNDVWIFNENLPDIDIGQFYEIESIILRLFPQNAAHDKTAIVVSSGLGRAMAELWRSSTNLPYQVEAFNKLDRAIEWVSPASA